MSEIQDPMPRARLSEPERLSFAARLGLFYAALFLIYGVHVPYLPVWLDWRGLTAEEIAAVTAAPFFIRLAVTPALALVADRLGNHRGMIQALCWAGLAFALVLSQMHGFWPVLFAAIAFSIAISTIMPLTEAVAIEGAKWAGLDYGRMRLWGSLSFIGVGLLGGALVDRLGAGIGIWLIVAGAAATAAAGHSLPRIAPATPAGADRGAWRGRFLGDEALSLVRSPLFLVFLLAAGAVQGAHAMFYAFGALNWRAQGISTTWVGALWAIGVLAEVLLFAYSGPVLRRFGAVALLICGSAAALVRWSTMSLDPPLWLLIPLQLLHALTYGASHLGAVHFISQAVSPGAAGTAQALYATVAAGLMMGGATLVSGPLYAAFGGRAYLAMAVLATVGLIASLLLQRWTGQAQWGAASGRPPRLN